MTGLSSISAKKIKILKKSDDVGSSRDWLVGQDAIEKKIIGILSRVFKISLKDLALELAMRQDSLRLALRSLEKKGVVVVELDDGSMSRGSSHNGIKTGKSEKRRRSGRNTFVRFLGYRSSESNSNDIMYR